MATKAIIERILSDLEEAIRTSDDSCLYDNVAMAESVLGCVIPELTNRLEEIKSYGGTLKRNAKIMTTLIQNYILEHKTIGYELDDFIIDDEGFNKLMEQAFEFYMEGKVANATQKLWDAFERLKASRATDKKKSIETIIDGMSHGDDTIYRIFDDEFKYLTTIGNTFQIRHYEELKTQSFNDEMYDYFFNRCLALLSATLRSMKEESK